MSDLLRFDQALEQRLRAVLPHEDPLGLVPGQVAADQPVDELLDALGVGGTGDDGVDGDPAGGRLLGEPAAHRQQRGLRHAVVDHLGRDDDGGVARDVEHPAPPPAGHPGRYARISRTADRTLISK
ncbi:hypothetical protein GCM10020295_74360 [Streptomyces cinereospinus]